METILFVSLVMLLVNFWFMISLEGKLKKLNEHIEILSLQIEQVSDIATLRKVANALSDQIQRG